MNRKTVEAAHTHTHQSITKQNWWTVWRERERERVYNLIEKIASMKMLYL